MTEVEVVDEVLVNRPVEVVWAAIIDPAVHAAWHPYVTEIRGEHREGAVRTCSVSVGRKPGRTDERCVELVPERSIAWLIEDDSSDFGGKVSDWRSGFSLRPQDGATQVTARSTFGPRSGVVRLLLPIVRRKFHRTQRTILTSLKRAVESRP